MLNLKNFKTLAKVALSCMLLMTVCLFILSCDTQDNGGDSTDTNNTGTNQESSSENESNSGSGTNNESGSNNENESGSNNENESNSENESGTNNEETSGETINPNLDPYDWKLTFDGDSATYCEDSDIEVDGNVYKIVKAGAYLISGTLDDGQIQVEVTGEEEVFLLLNDFTGSCSTSAVIYGINSDRITIDLQKGSENVLTDAENYVFEDGEDKPNACIYSADDIKIRGGGSLVVEGNFNNGIGSKNDIEINNGDVTVSAFNNAIKGNQSVTICGDAKVEVLSAEDAIKSDDAIKPNKGFVLITEEAKVTISCNDDAIQAPQNVTITTGATVTIKQAQSDVNCDGSLNIDEGTIIS